MEAKVNMDECYTVRDYRSWNDDARWELIDGVPYAMAPGANATHPSIYSELIYLVSAYLRGKACRVFGPPFTVSMSPPPRKTCQVCLSIREALHTEHFHAHIQERRKSLRSCIWYTEPTGIFREYV